MLLVPSNVAISDCELVECDQTQYFHKKNVKYEGIVPNDKGTHPFLLECCGLEYFESNRSVKELATDIFKAYNEVINSTQYKQKKIKPDMVGFYISNQLSILCNWDKTDEVYPHMRMEAIGGFSLPKVKIMDMVDDL